MAPVLLHLQALLLATAGTAILRRASWPQRAPRLGIVAWLALGGGVVVSVYSAGLALTMPAMPMSSSFAEFVHLCLEELRAQYSTPAGAATAGAGVVIMVAVASRVTICLCRVLRLRAVEREHHRLTLRFELGYLE